MCDIVRFVCECDLVCLSLHLSVRAMEFIQVFIAEVVGGEHSLDIAAGGSFPLSLPLSLPPPSLPLSFSPSFPPSTLPLLPFLPP